MKYIVKLGSGAYLHDDSWSSTKFNVYDTKEAAEKARDDWNNSHIISNAAYVVEAGADD